MSGRRPAALALIARAVAVRDAIARGSAYGDISAEDWAADVLAVAAGAGEALAEGFESAGRLLSALAPSPACRPPKGRFHFMEKGNGAAGQD